MHDILASMPTEVLAALCTIGGYLGRLIHVWLSNRNKG